jgi:hypothetical protein
MTRYDPKTWNIQEVLSERPENIINRTNNPLERFNGKLNSYNAKHPTMLRFVEIIKEVCCKTKQDLDDARANPGVTRAYKHQPVTLYTIPPLYHSWVPNVPAR